MCFVRCAIDGIDFVIPAFEPPIISAQEHHLDMFATFPVDLWVHIKSFEVFHIVHAYFFVAAPLVLDVRRAIAIDCMGMELRDPLFLYMFDIGEVFPLLAMRVDDFPAIARMRSPWGKYVLVSRVLFDVNVVFATEERGILA